MSERAAAFVKLLRQHHTPGDQLSAADILSTPGAMPIIAALMNRADVNARNFGVWLSAHVGDFDGLSGERKKRGMVYSLARLPEPVRAPVAVVPVVPVRPRAVRLRDAEAAGDRMAREQAEALPVYVEPEPEPLPVDPWAGATDRERATLEYLTREGGTGWTVEVLRAIVKGRGSPIDIPTRFIDALVYPQHPDHKRRTARPGSNYGPNLSIDERMRAAAHGGNPERWPHKNF